MRYRANGKIIMAELFPSNFEIQICSFARLEKAHYWVAMGKEQFLLHSKEKKKAVYQWLSEINLHVHVRCEAKLWRT